MAYVTLLAKASKIDVVVGKFEELGCFSFLNIILQVFLKKYFHKISLY